MNHKVKFHKATSPAFNTGEVWVGVSGTKVEVISVRKYPNCTGNHSSDYAVTYYTNASKDSTHEKDCWNFQVRYTHQADLHV
jgi:hypothetical protein